MFLTFIAVSKQQWLAVEPDPVRKENAILTWIQNEISQTLLIHFTNHINAAKLWDVELKVITLVWIEVRVDSAVLQVVDSIFVVSVEPYQSIHRVWIVIHYTFLLFVFLYYSIKMVKWFMPYLRCWSICWIGKQTWSWWSSFPSHNNNNSRTSNSMDRGVSSKYLPFYVLP